ncbi:hypothetical protein C9374_005914 [Naegleria lovaniensis]|uniref:DUF4116 domain-containing protein n=1 Tax=Naegleria lovaniensis TaxID=51637 RepID=A0AA88GPI7_NAELO|nr:uncharacterized protein C9374_005914 [Naegleria lovaniensis]KAG2382122.1 hypothetical protein C9374_005914 [Naegleria lovaniensis]
MSKREYSLIHSDFNPKTKTNEIWNDFISDHALEEIGITHSSSTNTKKQKICPRSFHHDEYEKVILADFSDNHDDHLRKWELLLKTKFTLQQQGKKKWLEHRELRFEHFFPVEFMNDPKFVFNHIQKYGYGLAFAQTQLKQDREFILKVVQCHGSQLQFTPFTLQNDREIVLTAIKKQPHAFRFASFALRDDREFILEAICGHNGEVLSYASPTLKKDKELLLAALKHNTSLINAWSLFSFHNTDWETIFEAIKQNKNTLEAVSHDLIQNPEFMLQAVKLIFPEFEHLQVFDYSTKEIMIRIVQEFGFLLKYMSKALRSDRDIVKGSQQQWHGICLCLKGVEE